MTNPTQQALAERDNTPGRMIETYRQDFATVLPTHVRSDTWVRLAQGVLRRDQNLARVAKGNVGSLMAALLECARLGHEPGTESFYLVPYGSEIQGIEGYRGVVERMYRAGKVTSVKAEVVRANDAFDYRPDLMARPVHRPDWFGDRGDIIGAYAYAELADGGTSRVVVINRDYIAKVKAQSKGSDKPSSPWVKWEEAMVLKTVAHRLEPWVPTSTEYRTHVLRDEARAQVGVEHVIEPAAALAPAPVQVTANVDTATGELLDDDVTVEDLPDGVDPTMEPGWGEGK